VKSSLVSYTDFANHCESCTSLLSRVYHKDRVVVHCRENECEEVQVFGAPTSESASVEKKDLEKVCEWLLDIIMTFQTKEWILDRVEKKG